MGYTLQWLVEGHVVLITSGQYVSIDELAKLDQDLLACMNKAVCPLVHIIYDISALELKPDLKAISKMRHPKDARKGWTCIIGDVSPIISFLITLASKIHKTRIKKVGSIEAAIEFLAQADPSIDFSTLSIK